MNKENEKEISDAVDAYRVALIKYIEASRAEDLAKIAKERARSVLSGARSDLRAKEQYLLSL